MHFFSERDAKRDAIDVITRDGTDARGHKT